MSQQLRILSLFSGIGSFEKALERQAIDYEIIGFSEIDKYAVESYCAIHNADKTKNLGDISKVDINDIPECDLITYGFPCQDISVAGNQKGIIEGKTRSGLLFEALKIIKAKKPKYAIAENVKNLVGKKFKEDFENLLDELDGYGYNNYWKVLNAKHYGIPQNRERVFVISIRKDIDTGFEFPEGFDNGLRLKDLLEDEVDEKYYISQDKVDKLIEQLKNKNSLMLDVSQMRREGRPREYSDYSPTLSARDYKEPRLISEKIELHSENEIKQIGSFDKEVINYNERQRRVYSDSGVSPTVLARTDNAKILQVGLLDIKGNEQVRRVYSDKGISPTLNTMQGGNRQPKAICAERGRYNADGEIEQQLEIQKESVSNTLTSVQKDNLVLEGYKEPKLEFIGGIESNKRIEDDKELSRNYKEGYRVYSPDGLATCQKSNGGGVGGCTGLYKVKVREATKKGYAVAELGDSINIQFPNSKTGRGRVQKGIAGTLETACNQAILTYNYRIRKLTQLECWRLMGFDDGDYFKSKSALEQEFYKGKDRSGSQMYKQAGNSICVNVLEEIFKSLF